jgi:hypothetical protein
MKIDFLNVDLEIESNEDLQTLVDELKSDCSISINDKRNNGNNFAVFSHKKSAFINREINAIISLY